ncbi:MAG TPA: hypothetical protein ENJ35_04215 [Gammaproteobacteria bacterium]|nr:hypothetical protein [Gammaproteobacteria bacterium]
MADSTTIDFTAKQGSQGLAAGNPLVFYEQYIDASALNLAAASYALFDVPEGHMHLSTVVEVLTAEGGTATADIGITGGDVDALIDGVDLNGTAGTLTWSGSAGTAEVHSVGGATAGYTTPDAGVTFSLLVNNALDAAKFRITSAWIDMRGQSTQTGDTA